MQTLTTANLSSGTAASVAASNLINIINGNETFRQSYRAYIDETNSALLHIEALKYGRRIQCYYIYSNSTDWINFKSYRINKRY